MTDLNGASPSVRFQHVLVTDVGQVRERNEDLAWGNDELGIYLLADGMGGHPDGNVASRLAIETAVSLLTGSDNGPTTETRAQRMARAILAANDAIMSASGAPAAASGMGTTLSCLWLHGSTAHIAHVGDSRIYRVRQGAIEQLTRDHTVANELITRGVLAADAFEARQLGHILTQAVGLEVELRPDLTALDAATGDVYLLCSDGLSDLIAKETMSELIANADGSLKDAADALVAAAMDAGGHDNVTVLLARIEEP